MFSATPELDAFPHRGEARLGAGKRQLVDIGVPKMDRSRRFPGFFRARSAFIPARTEWRALPQLLCLVGRATPCAHLLGYRHLQAAQAETHTTDWSSVLRPQFSGVDTYPELGLEQIRGLFPIWHIPCCYKSYANIAKSEMYAGFVCPHRLRHQGEGAKAHLKSAGMRCASRVARFYSLGLVSGGLREQAASFLRPSSVLRSVSMYCLRLTALH